MEFVGDLHLHAGHLLEAGAVAIKHAPSGQMRQMSALRRKGEDPQP